MTGTAIPGGVQPLSALDTVFLHLEDERAALHIAATAVFDGPPPSTRELTARFGAFIAAAPRYRQVLRRAPFDLQRPRWVDVPGDFDLEYHLRRTALPSPAGADQLDQLVGRQLSEPLDPDRPMWEACVVEGLADGRWALVIKAHHSMIDGLGGMALFTRLLDQPRTPVRALLLRRPEPAPTRAIVERLGDAVRLTGRIVRTAGRTSDGLLRYIGSLRPTTASSLTGSLGRAREYRTLTVDLADVRTVREAFGGTVNDVVLAMVTRGFRDLLLSRSEPPAPHSVRCLVPASTRAADRAAGGANSITPLLTRLPVEIDDAFAAYQALRLGMDALKASGEGIAGVVGFAIADLLPEPALAAALGAVRRFPQRVVTTVATNVPGPRRSRRMLGRRMVALYPYVPIAERIRVAVAVTCYVDQLYFGVTCDRASVPDVDIFRAAMADGLADLVKSAASPQ